MLPVFSVLIVFLPFLRIAQYFMRFVDKLKFFLRAVIVRIEIGMEFSCQLAVSFLNITFTGMLVHFKRLVIINKFHIQLTKKIKINTQKLYSNLLLLFLKIK